MKKPIAQISRVERYMAKYPSAKPREIAEALDIPLQAVYQYRMLIKKKRIQLQAMNDVESELDTAKKIHRLSMGKIRMQANFPREGGTVDNVNHPSHYKVGGIETIDFIEAKKLNYNLGNVIKYITRAEHKDSYSEDLQKARWYLDREIMSQHISK